MAAPEDVEKVILFPRYTTLLGATAFRTSPIQVREFESVSIAFWRGKVIGGTGITVTGNVQESPDLREWFAISGGQVTVPEDAEVVHTYDLRMDWIRVNFTVSGSGTPAVTCWAVGNFVRRRS